MNTFTVLKPENYETIFISLDENQAQEVFESSTVPLQICELPITDEDTRDIVEAYQNEWVDVNDFKYPTKRTNHSYKYSALTVDEFLNILVQCPKILNKMIAVEFWKDYPDTKANLENQLFEIFQQFTLQDE